MVTVVSLLDELYRGLELLSHWIYLALSSICMSLDRYYLKLEGVLR